MFQDSRNQVGSSDHNDGDDEDDDDTKANLSSWPV